ncbi:MAG TPA: hypothetical protein VFS77_14715 [Pyrinomonadaceae bacterium]|nr:hypothetical protein [Pyrinomonadaceae bacterium]
MNRKTLAGDRRRRKLITTLWALGVVVLVTILIYFERTAILYILCTLSVCALLLIVAFSDLGQSDAPNPQMAQPDDAARVAGRVK